MKLNFYLLAYMNCRKNEQLWYFIPKKIYFKYIWSQLFLSPIPPIFLFSTIPFSHVSHASLCITCDAVTQHVSSFSYLLQYSLSLKYCLFVSVNLWSFFFTSEKLSAWIPIPPYISKNFEPVFRNRFSWPVMLACPWTLKIFIYTSNLTLRNLSSSQTSLFCCDTHLTWPIQLSREFS